MAKRYHQSKKDRMHERMGEERYIESHMDQHGTGNGIKMGPYKYDRQSQYRAMGGAEHYAGMEPRRRQEMQDAGMIHEDPRAIANLPQGVIYRDYPRTGGYLPEDLDDTLFGIDRQMDFDNNHKMKHFYPKKV